ncbi:MYND-type domain-containing protein [Mycena sanguinolenta]|uniref:MYND-type domain-containing protein n=1 Tax=Mycena sanguinolenta TaxID=230812 RepID=A0A8H6XHX6_9AGAR|nr:MYND-type domain-containing protein [Mycena sanguinolenta]
MHPSLELSILDRIPMPFRIRAKGAVAGSAEDRLAFVVFSCQKMPDMSPEHLTFILPVLFAILEPDFLKIVPNELDSAVVPFDTGVRVTGILVTLRAISEILGRKGVPSGAYSDLWTRIWPWIELLDDHETIQTIDFLPAERGYRLYTSLIYSFLRNDEATEAVYTSSGVCAVVGRAWNYAVITRDDTELAKIHQLLECWFTRRGWSRNSFEELVIAAGGRRDLGAIVLAPVLRLLHTLGVKMTDDAICSLSALFNFVRHTTGVAGAQCDSAFRETLLSLGVVEALTSVSRVFAESRLSIAWDKLGPVFRTLVDYVSSFPCHKWLAQSIRAGLFSLIFFCGSRRHIEATRPSLMKLLQVLLPASSVYRSVLTELRNADTTHEHGSELFPEPDVFALFRQFMAPSRAR